MLYYGSSRWRCNSVTVFITILYSQCATQYCIYFSSGLNNHTISGNFIGGQAPSCGGSPWTNTLLILFTGSMVRRCDCSLCNIQPHPELQPPNVGSAYSMASTWQRCIQCPENMIGSTTVPGSSHARNRLFLWHLLSLSAVGTTSGRKYDHKPEYTSTTHPHIFTFYTCLAESSR